MKIRILPFVLLLAGCASASRSPSSAFGGANAAKLEKLGALEAQFGTLPDLMPAARDSYDGSPDYYTIESKFRDSEDPVAMARQFEKSLAAAIALLRETETLAVELSATLDDELNDLYSDAPLPLLASIKQSVAGSGYWDISLPALGAKRPHPFAFEGSGLHPASRTLQEFDPKTALQIGMRKGCELMITALGQDHDEWAAIADKLEASHDSYEKIHGEISKLGSGSFHFSYYAWLQKFGRRFSLAAWYPSVWDTIRKEGVSSYGESAMPLPVEFVNCERWRPDLPYTIQDLLWTPVSVRKFWDKGQPKTVTVECKQKPLGKAVWVSDGTARKIIWIHSNWGDQHIPEDKLLELVKKNVLNSSP